MIIALVGCDCSGKSTCFNKIDKSIGTFVKGVQIKGINVQYLSELKQKAESDDLYIFDRIPIMDDFVYSPIFNKGAMSDLFWLLDDVREIAQKCTFIYFKCPVGEITRRMASRGDEYVSIKNIDSILINYAVTFEILKVKPVIVSTYRLNEEQTLEKVMEVIKNENRRNCAIELS